MYYRPFGVQRDTKLQQKIERRKGLTHCALISHKKHMLRTQKVVVFEKSVGAKLVNHYQQLTIIDGGQDRSTIINNYPKLQKEKEVNNYQQLTTIAMIMSGQPLSTIIQNCKRTR